MSESGKLAVFFVGGANLFAIILSLALLVTLEGGIVVSVIILFVLTLAFTLAPALASTFVFLVFCLVVVAVAVVRPASLLAVLSLQGRLVSQLAQ